MVRPRALNPLFGGSNPSTRIFSDRSQMQTIFFIKEFFILDKENKEFYFGLYFSIILYYYFLFIFYYVFYLMTQLLC